MSITAKKFLREINVFFTGEKNHSAKHAKNSLSRMKYYVMLSIFYCIKPVNTDELYIQNK